MRTKRPFPEDETPESRKVRVLPEVEELRKAHICQEEEQWVPDDPEALIASLQLDNGVARPELVAELSALMGTSTSGGSSSSADDAGATYPISIKVAEMLIGDCTGVTCGDTGLPIPED
jgi:hypothetical protein